MEFSKTQIINNLKELENAISVDGLEAVISGHDEADIAKIKEDLMFVRGLMDDIECGRITEFPMVEKTNLMTGNVYLEDPDTPISCSPASETFWCM